MIHVKSFNKNPKVAKQLSGEAPFSVDEMLKNVLPSPVKENHLSDDEKIEKIAHHMKAILETLGLDLSNDSIHDTPKRVAKMYVKEIFSGLNSDNFPKITCIENSLNYDEMVTVKEVKLISTCEHHLVTIDGYATISYIPNKKVIGLSKINRIAKFFARRPQVQERLTKQIADCLEYILETPHVAIQIQAKHYCVIQRGIEDQNSETVTTDLRGCFRDDPRSRTEFLALCRRNS